MKSTWTKKELIEFLNQFNDDDQIVINIHDDVFYEDNYNFTIDPIHMGLDENKQDRGYEIQICPVQNVEAEEVTVEDALDRLGFQDLTSYPRNN